jgi:PhnB protein
MSSDAAGAATIVLIPHLAVKGGEQAIQFYEKAFRAVLTVKTMADDDARVLHAALTINGATLYLSDEFPEFGAGATPSPATLGGSPVALHLHYTTARLADEAYQRAVDAGAEVVMDMSNASWGDRCGRLRDPFGHVWSLGGPLSNPQDTY